MRYFYDAETERLEHDDINSVSRIIGYGENVMVREECFINKGTIVPLHSHKHEQITHVTKGSLIVLTENGDGQLLREGDAVYFDAYEKHGVRTLEERTTVIDSFSPVRLDHLENRTRYNV